MAVGAGQGIHQLGRPPDERPVLHPAMRYGMEQVLPGIRARHRQQAPDPDGAMLVRGGPKPAGGHQLTRLQPGVGSTRYPAYPQCRLFMEDGCGATGLPLTLLLMVDL